MNRSLSRRGFLGLAATAGTLGVAGCASAPALVSSRSPNGKLRMAAVGCGGEGRYDIRELAKHRRLEFAAFCDVDLRQMDPLREKFPKARYYQHWREMLDRENPDAVLVADKSRITEMKKLFR